MRNLDFYIKTAMEKQGLKSKRELCAALGISHSATDAYNRGSLPADETMEKLANFAGIDCHEALIELNYWRSPATVKKTYASILQKMSHAAAVMMVVIVAGLGFTANTAVASPTENCQYENRILYIMENNTI